MKLAPGTEVVEAVFRYFGSEYVKRSDAVRIARAMRTDEIDSEIAEAIDHAIALTDRRSSPYSSLRLSPLAPFPTRR